MLPVQRKNAMIQFLAQQGSAAIGELCAHLGVSVMTVHRDLKRLEEEGVVQKTHGGAIYLGAQAHEPAFRDKAGELPDIKRKLAACAVRQFVRDRSVIVLEGGTTVSCMAPPLGEFTEMTVATNGHETAGQLRAFASRMTVLCCGGIMREVSGTFTGPLAESFFAAIHADVLFLSASGYAPDAGFTDPNMMESQVKKAMRASAAKTVMLLDSSKFGKRSLITTFSAAEIDALITDKDASDEMLQPFRKLGIEVYQV